MVLRHYNKSWSPRFLNTEKNSIFGKKIFLFISTQIRGPANPSNIPGKAKNFFLVTIAIPALRLIRPSLQWTVISLFITVKTVGK